MNGAIGIMLLLAAGLVALWAAVVLMTVRLLTRPPRRSYASAVSKGKAGDPGELATPREFSTWSLKAEGGEFPVWDIPSVGPPEPDAPVVILAHGWGDSKLGALSRLAALDRAARTVAIDLPGHGDASRSPGFSLGVGEVAVLGALLDEVRRQEPDRPLVLWGWSLGAGVCLAAAARAPQGIAGVIAESPYRHPWTPARNVLRLYGLPHRFTLLPALWIVGMRGGIGWKWTGFDRAEHAVRLRANAPGCGLLVVHGVEDDICPIADGRKIAETGRGTLAPIEGKGHNDLWSGEGTPAGIVRDFLAGLRTKG